MARSEKTPQERINLIQLEQLIREGNGSLAKSIILTSDKGDLSREEKLKLANLSRRVSLPTIAISLLRPLIYPPRGKPSDSTPAERSEYACALVKEGLVSEALKILKTVDTEAAPEALLYTAFALFNRWDYEAAIPHLRKYVASSVNGYQKNVGYINLVAALIFTKETTEAREHLQKIIAEAEASQNKLLLCYANELMGQTELEDNNFEDAKTFFTKAKQLSAQTSTSTSFLIRKWLLIIDLKVATPTNKTEKIKNLQALQQEALTLQDFETVRACDLHLAIATQDANLVQKIYFGTPHTKLKQKIKRQTESFTEIGIFYDQKIRLTSGLTQETLKSGLPQTATRVFNMQLAQENDQSVALKPGQSLHRLYRVLLADTYKPVRATEIFSLVFPNEYFDPAVSLNRVHQAMLKLRLWLKKNNVPLVIHEKKNTYWVEATGDYAIRWPQRFRATSKQDALVVMIQNSFGLEEFTAVEYSRVLNKSPRTASREIQTLVDSGSLQKHGRGPSTVYNIANKALPSELKQVG